MTFNNSIATARTWYAIQNTKRTDLALPLPGAPGVRFLYGCETEMDYDFRIGISAKEVERRAFIIVPTTHLHMKDLAIRAADRTTKKCAQLWVDRFDALLQSGLPFHKVGIAHLTCTLFSPEKTAKNTAECLSLIKSEDMKRLFADAAKKGLAIELNFTPEPFEEIGALDELLRPYRIAIECGCKFYLGSDAHAPQDLDAAMPNFERIVSLLDLTEDQKFLLQ
jgi:histidinol phosphatase-like PHP family hydrolase